MESLMKKENDQKTLLHFEDALGRKLYVGDAIFRVEQNGLHFGVCGHISESGSLYTGTEWYHEHTGETKYYRGFLTTINSDKIIKISKKSLTPSQMERYNLAYEKIKNT